MDRISYMRAHLRLNTNADVAKFTDIEVVESFALLTLPKVQYPEWVQTMAILAGSGENQEEAPEEDRGDPVERLMNEGKHLFEAGIVRLGA